MNPIIPIVVGGIKNLVEGFFERKKEAQQHKREMQLQKVQNGIPGPVDEIVTFLWSAPFTTAVLGVFFPSLQPRVAEMIVALEGLPDWYMWAWGSISFAAVGITTVFRWKRGQ